MSSDNAPIRVHPKGLKDNQAYYDEFAGWYEKERHHGYHAFLDDMAVDLLRPYAEGKRVLEVGCGTGLILKRVAGLTDEAYGFDLSAGMLGRTRERGLRTVQASATHLPFPIGAFDLVYSFKVLAHVPDIDRALDEIARVTRRGGHAVLEFYNRNSLRWLVKRLKPAHAISEGTTDHEVYTRYDTLSDLVRRMPSTLRLRAVNGIRVVTPAAAAFRHPLTAKATWALEKRLARSPLARFAGFLVLVLERR
jgi:ubiquinone/menaquinone biosynthesis C-methylase UbiE